MKQTPGYPVHFSPPLHRRKNKSLERSWPLFSGGPWTDPRPEPRLCTSFLQARLPLTIASAAPAPGSLSRQSFPAARPLPSLPVRVPQISTSPPSQPCSPSCRLQSTHRPHPATPQPPPQAEFQLGCKWGPSLHYPSRIEGLGHFFRRHLLTMPLPELYQEVLPGHTCLFPWSLELRLLPEGAYGHLILPSPTELFRQSHHT